MTYMSSWFYILIKGEKWFECAVIWKKAHYFQELLTREPFLPILITRKGNPGPSGVNFGEESLPEPGLYLYLLIL